MKDGFDEAAFLRVAKALAPYLDDIVFVGGWAFRLFRLHPLALVPAYPPLMTKDADIAAPESLPRRSDSIRDLLLRDNFREELSGESRPPKTAYRFGEGDDEVYVEFLTSLSGSTRKRDGSLDATAKIQGVTAEKLRHIDLLLTSPWSVELTEAEGYPVGLGRPAVKLCNPVCYLAQKVLAFSARKPEKRGKDILYIHDTLLLFGGAFEHLREIWVRSVREQLHKKARRKVVEAAGELFGRVTDESIDAVEIARRTGKRTLSADRLAAVGRSGLAQIFIP